MSWKCPEICFSKNSGHPTSIEWVCGKIKVSHMDSRNSTLFCMFVLYSWKNKPDKSDFVGIILGNWSKAYYCLLYVLLVSKLEAYDISRKDLIGPYSFLLSKSKILHKFSSQLLVQSQEDYFEFKNISNNLRNGPVFSLPQAIFNNYGKTGII